MVNNHQSHTVIAEDTAKGVSENRHLSFDEMKSMLQNAEKRLLGQVPPRVDAITHDARTRRAAVSPCVYMPRAKYLDFQSSYRLPKLDNTMDAEPYLNVNSKVARVDSAKSINNNERRLANRRVRMAVEGRVHKLDSKVGS